MTRVAWSVGVVALFGATVFPVARADDEPDPNASPDLCGPEDTPETGIQGDIPTADQDSGRADEGYNCGLSLVAELPDLAGTVQGSGHCAYVRNDDGIFVLDMIDPVNPEIVNQMPLYRSDRPQIGGGSHGSETMRAVTTEDRAVLVSGRGVWDIRDCENPVLKGEIAWAYGIYETSGESHDIRVSRDGTKVYASTGVKAADITNLDDPSTWTVTEYKCHVAAQYHPLHQAPAAAGVSQCDYGLTMFPQQSHGPDVNGDGSRLYVGNQLFASTLTEEPTLRVLDMTQDPPTVLDDAPGPGHAVDWFRIADGREFVLHANEIAFGPTTCVPQEQRLSSLGWANEAFLTEVTGDELERASLVELAINKPENCQAKLDSGQSPQTTYHAIDNHYDASFAMVSFGDAGLRIFDIRDPYEPVEVAYFNTGSLVHGGVAHFDAARGLIYVPGSDAFKVLEVQPQVLQQLGLEASHESYPRYPDGRPATP